MALLTFPAINPGSTVTVTLDKNALFNDIPAIANNPFYSDPLNVMKCSIRCEGNDSSGSTPESKLLSFDISQETPTSNVTFSSRIASTSFSPTKIILYGFDGNSLVLKGGDIPSGLDLNIDNGGGGGGGNDLYMAISDWDNQNRAHQMRLIKNGVELTDYFPTYSLYVDGLGYAFAPHPPHHIQFSGSDLYALGSIYNDPSVVFKNGVPHLTSTIGAMAVKGSDVYGISGLDVIKNGTQIATLDTENLYNVSVRGIYSTSTNVYAYGDATDSSNDIRLGLIWDAETGTRTAVDSSLESGVSNGTELFGAGFYENKRFACGSIFEGEDWIGYPWFSVDGVRYLLPYDINTAYWGAYTSAVYHFNGVTYTAGNLAGDNNAPCYWIGTGNPVTLDVGSFGVAAIYQCALRGIFVDENHIYVYGVLSKYMVVDGNGFIVNQPALWVDGVVSYLDAEILEIIKG